MKTEDPEMLDALLELLAVIAPSPEEEKYKNEIAWTAIDYGYKHTQDCGKSCRKYLGVAV